MKFTSLMRTMFVSPVDLFGSDCLDQLCLKMSARGIILDDSVLASWCGVASAVNPLVFLGGVFHACDSFAAGCGCCREIRTAIWDLRLLIGVNAQHADWKCC